MTLGNYLFFEARFQSGREISNSRPTAHVLPTTSVGSTFTFGVVVRTRVRIPLRTFLLKQMLARASYDKHVSLGAQDLDRS